MKKRVLLTLMCLSIFVLVACGGGVVSCEDEAPVKDEDEIELVQENNQSIDNTEDINAPAAEGEGPEGLPTPEVSNLGIALTVKDVTPRGLTIVCIQSGGESTGELNTGSYYVLEKEVQGVWCIVEYAQDVRGMEICWDAVAWSIPMDDTVEWEVDWGWLYGSLPSGHYRIGKEIMDFRKTGDYDKAMHYAEFEIEE